MAKRRRRPHGHGSIYERNGNWWIQWREHGRRRYAKFPTRELAAKVLAKIVADIAAGRGGLPPDPKDQLPLAQLAEKWLERRMATHRAASDDRNRWTKHLRPAFGTYRPGEVDAAAIRAFVEAKLFERLSSTSVGHCVRLLSSLYTDLVERGAALVNPVRALPRSTRRLYRNAHDPKTTPYLQRPEDIRAVFLKLPELVGVAFAVGALAGLRTGEVLGLQWADVDLEARRIHVVRQVHDSKLAPLKDDDSRLVPIQSALLPVLRAWRVRTGGEGLLFRARHAGRGGRLALGGSPATFVLPSTLLRSLRAALAKAKLPPMTWYQATRHTFASQWALAGGSIARLSAIMGHSSVEVTERYAHLGSDSFTEAEHDMVSVDLSRPTGAVLNLAGREIGGAAAAADRGGERDTG